MHCFIRSSKTSFDVMLYIIPVLEFAVNVDEHIGNTVSVA